MGRTRRFTAWAIAVFMALGGLYWFLGVLVGHGSGDGGTPSLTGSDRTLNLVLGLPGAALWLLVAWWAAQFVLTYGERPRARTLAWGILAALGMLAAYVVAIDDY